MLEIFTVVILEVKNDAAHFRHNGRNWSIGLFPAIRTAKRGQKMEIKVESPYGALSENSGEFWPAPYGPFRGAKLVISGPPRVRDLQVDTPHELAKGEEVVFETTAEIEIGDVVHLQQDPGRVYGKARVRFAWGEIYYEAERIE